MQLTKIITDESLMELTQHGTPSFPCEFYYDVIQKYDIGRINWHWHKEFEFAIAKSDDIQCLVGNQAIVLKKGDGIFLNSGIIHSFETTQVGLMPNILFSHEFIAPIKSAIHEKFIEPFLLSEISHLVLTDSTSWQKEILERLNQIFQQFTSSNSITMELEVHTLVCTIWNLLFQHKDKLQTIEASGTSRLTQSRLRTMLRYIELNYSRKLSLDYIAQAANISISEALRCFKTSIHISPIHYLNQYRLFVACELLTTTKQSVSLIAEKTGFENPSYFNRLFKRAYGITPSEFREEKRR